MKRAFVIEKSDKKDELIKFDTTTKYKFMMNYAIYDKNNEIVGIVKGDTDA